MVECMNVREGARDGTVSLRGDGGVGTRGAFARGIDTGAVVIGFLLGGCHTLFGA